MSRICALCLALCFLFVLVACSNGTSVQTNEPNTTQTVEDVADLTETTASEPIKNSGFDFEIIPTEEIYEQKDMGDMPEIVSLSELDFDTTYVYSINHYQDVAPNPQIINDTDYTAIKNKKDDSDMYIISPRFGIMSKVATDNVDYRRVSIKM